MVAYLDDLLGKWADGKNRTTPTPPHHPTPPKLMRWANFHNFHPILTKLGMEVNFGGIRLNERKVWLGPISVFPTTPYQPTKNWSLRVISTTGCTTLESVTPPPKITPTPYSPNGSWYWLEIWHGNSSGAYFWGHRGDFWISTPEPRYWGKTPWGWKWPTPVTRLRVGISKIASMTPKVCTRQVRIPNFMSIWPAV